VSSEDLQGDLPGLALGTKVFLPLWLVAAGLAMWVGISRAGHHRFHRLPFDLATASP